MTLALFIVYLLFCVWLILFKLEFSLKELEETRAYNFIPFYYEDGHNIELHFSEVINNILIFIPAGVYLCLLFKEMSLWKRAILILAVSLALECAQYILAVGRFDITDIIMNTVGGVVGVGICSIIRVLFRDKDRADRVTSAIINSITVLLVGGICIILSLN